MNKHLRILIYVVSFGPFLLTGVGCSPASPPIFYHSLVDLDPAQQTTATDTATDAATVGRLSILIGPVSTPDILKNSKITTGGAESRYQLSEQHRWAGEVNHDFARAVGEQLAHRLGTEQIAIFPREQHLKTTHQIVLDILTMEGNLGKEAILIVRWSLIDPQSKTVRLIRRSTFSEQPADAGYDAWVSAQRRNVNRLSEEIAAVIKAEH